jgi:hypothetical protein
MEKFMVVGDLTSPQVRFALEKLTETSGTDDAAEIAVAIRPDAPGLRREGFRIVRVGGGLRLDAADATGAMYGLLDVAEQLRMGGSLAAVQEKTEAPRFPFRAVKFNLPWSEYRPNAAVDVHLDTCRDLRFWQRFLDMLAENRFNALTLWNCHPFTYMIRPTDYPLACPFNDAELAEWQTFWRGLFRMAKERGIETYLVNWNIVVSPAFAAAYGARERNDTSPLVRDYTRRCVTQTIDSYADLSGLGVTLADWMEEMTPTEREDWIAETFVAGMQAATRPVKFIHRSVLAGSPTELRRVIDNAHLPDPAIVEIKFNWSHGHSTPHLGMTHDYNSGAIDERFWQPAPTNFQIAWMIRNEDFFILRWGDPEFIRAHIAANGQAYVGGYFVGSEMCIPARDYSHVPHAHMTWDYAFEKQWLFYMTWGRLLYQPETSDAIFAAEFARRYGRDTAETLLQAYTLASRMPLRLASFHAATWDFTLYAEGFLAAAPSRGAWDNVSPFISIDEFIDHQTLDPNYLSIPDFLTRLLAGETIPEALTTPLHLADDSAADGLYLLELIEELHGKVTADSGALECEIADLEAWAHLCRYLAEKLRAGVALEHCRRTGEAQSRKFAIELLTRAATHWDALCAVTAAHYHDAAFIPTGEIPFAWSRYRDQVARDIQIARDVTLPHR